MTLSDKAYIEIERSSGTNATFEIWEGLEHSESLTKSYVMGARGQYIQEIVNQTPLTGGIVEGRRRGYWIDGGAGDWGQELSFEVSPKGIQWGDGSGGTGPSNVTKTDASGEGVAAISRKNIFTYWISTTKSDSGGTTTLHHGEWTNGNIAHVSGVSAGAFGQPMPVAIQQMDFSGPGKDQPGVAECRLEVSNVDLWGGKQTPEWAEDAVGAAQDAADFMGDA